VGELRHVAGFDFSDSAYCQARQHFPVGFFHCPHRAVLGPGRASAEDNADALWQGHRLFALGRLRLLHFHLRRATRGLRLPAQPGPRLRLPHGPPAGGVRRAWLPTHGGRWRLPAEVVLHRQGGWQASRVSGSRACPASGPSDTLSVPGDRNGTMRCRFTPGQPVLKVDDTRADRPLRIDFSYYSDFSQSLNLQGVKDNLRVYYRANGRMAMSPIRSKTRGREPIRRRSLTQGRRNVRVAAHQMPEYNMSRSNSNVCSQSSGQV
jgi:hypothetical protein